MSKPLKRSREIARLNVKFAADQVNQKIHELGKAYYRYYSSICIDTNSVDSINWIVGDPGYKTVDDAKHELDNAIDAYTRAMIEYTEVSNET